VARRVSFIAECLTEFLDCCVQAVVEIHKGVRSPEPLTKFLSRDEFARFLKKDFEDLDRLPCNFNTIPSLLTCPNWVSS
jgi:hypothetical protein